MAKIETKEPTRFVVNLGNLELPPVMVRQIESEIRAVVLGVLANLGTVSSSRLDPSLFGNFTGRTLGLWIDPEHPEQGSWEDTVPLGFRKDGVTPFVTRNEALIPSKLAATKASGAEAIRISRTKGALHLEQLDAHGQPIVSFVLRPIAYSKKKVSSVEITRTDSDSDGRSASLGRRDPALAAIVDELRQFRGEQPSSPGVIYFWRDFFEAIDAGIACGLAGVEAGANPIADAGCSVALGLFLDDDDDDDD
jgi:hypothetical protein